MNRLSLKIIRPVCVLLQVFSAGCGTDSHLGGAETQTIPLEQIWAYEMPGTRDVRELEPDVYGTVVRTLSAEERDRRFNESLVAQILESLGPPPAVKPGPIRLPDPKAVFAVKGAGFEALKEAYAVLVEKQTVPASLPTGSEISIVFFSYEAGSFVQVRDVERRRKVIQIRYRFAPHGLAIATSHIALIPLGPLPAGEYQIAIIQSPMDTKWVPSGTELINLEWEKKVVCKPSSFSVVPETVSIGR